MKLYRTTTGCLLEENNTFYPTHLDFDQLVAHEDLEAYCATLIATTPVPAPAPEDTLPPIGSQEVWAAGVTYYRSRSARIEESKDAGGGDFYDRVYSAERPEIFFKATAPRVVGPNASVHIRSDSKWSVPEPELTLLINPAGTIIGYTIGNDMSSRDIEGENPLYLSQAKMYDRSCALGPCVLITSTPLPLETNIAIAIHRNGTPAFSGTTQLTELKRDPKLLVEYLFRDNSFPHGAFLMTGTGVVPPDDFTLQPADKISITIDPIGTLTNPVD